MTDTFTTGICDLIKMDEINDIDETFESETKLLRSILDNTRLIRLVKASLNNVIKKLIHELKFDPNSLLSDNVHKFGNIGVCKISTEVSKKLEYLISFESTIREKVTAISNTLINDSGSNDSLKKINAGIMCDYIRKNSKNTSNDWIMKRAENVDQITNIKSTEYLWAPIYLLYDMYRMKLDKTKKLLNNVKSFDHKMHGIYQTDLNEPLSKFELEFIRTIGSNIDIETKLLWMPGKYVYKDSVSVLPEFKTRDNSLIIGGVSGHTILMMELALLLNVNWTPILFACIITQVPHHHSITEIIDALVDMKLTNNSNVNRVVLELGKQLGIDLKYT